MANPYELQRKRISQDSEAERSQQVGAMERRFARMGGLNSGSAVKAQERLGVGLEQNRQRAMEGVDIQEAQAEEVKAESQRGRDFAAGQADLGRTFSREERLGSQDFASGEAHLGRMFARDERIDTQGFQAEQAGIDRGWRTGERLGSEAFSKGERESSQTFASGERKEGQTFARGEREASQQWHSTEAGYERALKVDAMTEQKRQFDHQYVGDNSLWAKQFAEDKETTEFNKRMAEKSLKPTGIEAWGSPFRKGAFFGQGGEIAGLFGQKKITSDGDGSYKQPKGGYGKFGGGDNPRDTSGFKGTGRY